MGNNIGQGMLHEQEQRVVAGAPYTAESVIAAATTYTFVFVAGVEGVALDGVLGKIIVWESGKIERPAPCWPAPVYDPALCDPRDQEWILEARVAALEWLIKAKS